jgi:hypothetical protein
MSRNRTENTVVEDVDVPVETTEVEDTVSDTAGTEAASDPSTANKPPKMPARPDAPEGYVTPINFANALKAQRGVELRPQVVYSYIKNQSKVDPFPSVDSTTLGEQKSRPLVNLEEGLAWFDRKEQRKTERSQNAQAKAAAKAEKAAARAESGNDNSSEQGVVESSTEVTEAE